MDSSRNDFIGSEVSLNLAQKLPGILKKSEPLCIKVPKTFTINEDNKSQLEKNGSLRSPTLRKKNYSKNSRKSINVFAKSKKEGESPGFKISNLKKFNIARNVRKSALNMVRNFRKRKLYSTLKNLSEYHYKIIGDVVANPDDSKEEKKLIYDPFNGGKKIVNLMNKLFMERIFKVFKTLRKKLQIYVANHIPTFNPNSPLNVIWDFIVMTITFLRIYFYSLEKGFVTDLNLESLGSLLLVVLIFDIGIKLNTKIFQEGIQITERSLILREFMRRNIFSDIVPCLALCVLYFSDDHAIFNELNLLLCGKILKTVEVAERVKGIIIKSDRAESAYNFIVLLIKIFLMAHSIACLWHYIGYYCNERYPSEKNWLKMESIVDEPWGVKYLYSIYWAITTMLTVGYGDIIPSNNNERLFNIWAMFIGCGMFGYTMNSIGEIIKYAERKNGELKEQMNRVTLMMRGKNLPIETQTKVKKYLEFVWNQDQKEDPEHENHIMSKLSSKLRDEIFFHTHVKYLKTVPVFKTFSDKTLIELASHMKRVRFSPEEFVYREGDHDELCLYFVLEGKLSLVNERALKSPIIWRHYKKDDYFGVEEVFTGKGRAHGLFSLDFSSLFQISRRDIINVLQKIPYDYEKFCQIKDLEVLYNEHTQYEIPCISCKFKDHTISNCKYLKYDPIRLIVIGKYNSKKKAFAKKFRRKVLRTNALIDKNNNSSTLNDFLEVYNDDDDFNELKSLYILLDKEKQHSYESIDVPESHEGDFKEMMQSGMEVNATRSMKSIRNPTYINKSTRRITNISHFEMPREQNYPKFERNKGPREATICKSVTSSQFLTKEKQLPPPMLNIDKMKSYLYYFPNNNVENIIERLNTRSLNKMLL